MDNDEGVIKLAHGGSIRCPAHPADCTYVRIVDAEGNEVLYWDWHEWRDDPEGRDGRDHGRREVGSALIEQAG